MGRLFVRIVEQTAVMLVKFFGERAESRVHLLCNRGAAYPLVHPFHVDGIAWLGRCCRHRTGGLLRVHGVGVGEQPGEPWTQGIQYALQPGELGQALQAFFLVQTVLNFPRKQQIKIVDHGFHAAHELGVASLLDLQRSQTGRQRRHAVAIDGSQRSMDIGRGLAQR